MANSSNSIPLGEMPYCIPSFHQGEPLRQWLEDIDRKVSETVPTNRDTFSKGDFDYARSQLWGADLKRFRNFDRFHQFVEKYAWSYMCGDKCIDEVPIDGYLHQRVGGEGPQPVRICPDTPILPPIEEPPKRIKPKDKPKPKNPLPPPPNLSMTFPKLDENLLDESPLPLDPSGKPIPMADASLPNAEGLVDNFPPLAMRDWKREAELPAEPIVPNTIRTSYDGKDFILDLHGCIVGDKNLHECLRDWPLFWLVLTNTQSDKNSRKQANMEGLARIRVTAKRGDIIKFYAFDSVDGRRSLNTLWFKVTQNGKIKFLGSGFLDKPITFLGSLKNFGVGFICLLAHPIINPEAYGQYLKELKEAHKKEAYKR